MGESDGQNQEGNYLPSGVNLAVCEIKRRSTFFGNGARIYASIGQNGKNIPQMAVSYRGIEHIAEWSVIFTSRGQHSPANCQSGCL